MGGEGVVAGGGEGEVADAPFTLPPTRPDATAARTAPRVALAQKQHLATAAASGKKGVFVPPTFKEAFLRDPATYPIIVIISGTVARVLPTTYLACDPPGLKSTAPPHLRRRCVLRLCLHPVHVLPP